MGNGDLRLSERRCQPCEGRDDPFGKEKIGQYLEILDGWALANDGVSIFREYKMMNFTEAVNLINKIAGIAEAQGHHPDVHLTRYKYLRIDLSTHAIDGLSENDFIMAAKIDEIAEKQ